MPGLSTPAILLPSLTSEWPDLTQTRSGEDISAQAYIRCRLVRNHQKSLLIRGYCRQPDFAPMPSDLHFTVTPEGSVHPPVLLLHLTCAPGPTALTLALSDVNLATPMIRQPVLVSANLRLLRELSYFDVHLNPCTHTIDAQRLPLSATPLGITINCPICTHRTISVTPRASNIVDACRKSNRMRCFQVIFSCSIFFFTLQICFSFFFNLSILGTFLHLQHAFAKRVRADFFGGIHGSPGSRSSTPPTQAHLGLA